MRVLLVAATIALGACAGREDVSAVPPAAPRWVERTAAARRPPTDGRPPLLVLLHGIGADENDLFPLARRLDPRLVAVSLRAPHDYHGGHAWFHIEFPPGGGVVPDVEQAHEALDDLVRWIAAAPVRLGTDPSRTFLLGFSQGAMMSLGALRRIPERLAGVIALSGRAPDDLFPPTARPDSIGRVPLLVCHGRLDDLLPVAEGRRVRDTVGPHVRDFSYREFDVGHGIAEDEVTLVAAWLSARLDRPPAP